MTSFGAQLRKARETRGWTVDFVCFKSKIRPAIIEHLEADRYAIFSSDSYARSFLRKYAEFLELDIAEQIEEFQFPGLEAGTRFAPRGGAVETLETAQFSRKNRRFRKASQGTGSPVFLAGSVAALISAFAAFYYLGSRANVPAAGAGGLMEGFENQQAPFSREKAATERIISIDPLGQTLEASPPQARPVTLVTFPDSTQNSTAQFPKKDLDHIAKPAVELPEALAAERPMAESRPRSPAALRLNPLLE